MMGGEIGVVMLVKLPHQNRALPIYQEKPQQEFPRRRPSATRAPGYDKPLCSVTTPNTLEQDGTDVTGCAWTRTRETLYLQPIDYHRRLHHKHRLSGSRHRRTPDDISVSTGRVHRHRTDNLSQASSYGNRKPMIIGFLPGSR